MNATATLPEQLSSCREESDLRIVIDCRRGTDRPRWDLIETSFYETELAALEETLTVSPLFHVKPEASPFSVCVELQGAVFASPQPDPSFHHTSDTFHPITFLVLGGRHVRLAWSGSDPAAQEWGRWIYRFFVQEEESPGPPQPVYLAFTCLPPESKPALRRRLTPPAPAATAYPATAAAFSESEQKLRFHLALSSDGDPVFRGLFRSDRRRELPDDVYLEPLIVVKEAEQRVDFEFVSDDGVFFPGERGDCDPGLPEKNPLALLWRGVTDPKPGCGLPDQTSARGFLASWNDPDRGRATLCWQEPSPDEIRRRVASFFFVNRAVKGGGDGDTTQTGSLEFASALVDPTVVHDQDSPPRG